MNLYISLKVKKIVAGMGSFAIFVIKDVYLKSLISVKPRKLACCSLNYCCSGRSMTFRS